MVTMLEHVVGLIQYHYEDDEFLVRILRQHTFEVYNVREIVEILHHLIYEQTKIREEYSSTSFIEFYRERKFDNSPSMNIFSPVDLARSSFNSARVSSNLKTIDFNCQERSNIHFVFYSASSRALSTLA